MAGPTALTGTSIGTTYVALLKMDDNAATSGSLRAVTDGLGNSTALQVSTAGVKSTGTFNSAGAATMATTLAVTGATTLAGALSTAAVVTNTSNGPGLSTGINDANFQATSGSGFASIGVRRSADTNGGWLVGTSHTAVGDFGILQNQGAGSPPVIRASISTTGDFSLTGNLIVPTHTPSSASDTGTAGTITWDASFVYVCTATNTWKRAAIATW